MGPSGGEPQKSIVFGPFTLLPNQQQLLLAGTPVHLGSRALLILMLLVERAGETVTNEDLMSRAWPGTYVVEGNVRVHVAALRRSLGDGRQGNRYIINVPGRGYSFVGQLQHHDATSFPELTVQSGPRPGNLPLPVVRIVGRGDLIAACATEVVKRRFITLVGPGGIGKSTVALAVAAQLQTTFLDGVHFVDLATVGDPDLVPSTLAAVLGVAVRTDNALPSLLSSLKEKHVLFLIDSCEHLIGAAAGIAEALLQGSSKVHIVATSREPLRASGEHIVRLQPLEVPPYASAINAVEAFRFTAIQLFVERASASLETFELTDVNAAVVAEICIKLDGIALAIEMAAARIDTFGLQGVAERLEDRFNFLTRGRRTALPRHKTLRAVIDWSYDLLSETERRVFRQIGVFAGWFTSEAAAAVITESEKVEVIETIADLFAKSLLTADVSGSTTFYRLLDTTRAYALEKIPAAEGLGPALRAHAVYFSELFERAEREWHVQSTADWMSDYGRYIGDLRSALDWAFSAEGDVSVGITITAAAIPLWFELSLLEEARSAALRALAAEQSMTLPDARRSMLLHAALAWSQMYTSASQGSADSSWARALGLAERLDDTDFQLRSLWGLWAGRINCGQFSAALAFANRFATLAELRGDPTDALVGDRMRGASLHFLGDHSGARTLIERVLLSYVTPEHRSHTVRFQFDQYITAHITLERILWLRGFPTQAMDDAERNIQYALAVDHTLSLCNALVQAACPVALLCGDLDRAEFYNTMLLLRTSRDALDIWHCYGECFEGELFIRRGDVQIGLQRLLNGINRLRKAGFVQYLGAFLAIVAEALVAAGRLQEARDAIEEALRRSHATDERWSMPELLRISGVVAAAEGDISTASEYFNSSLTEAREQGALAWELRTVMSLCNLNKGSGAAHLYYDLLAETYSRFSEGHLTIDLVAAKAMMDSLTTAPPLA